MRVGLALGAGGIAGGSWHAGVLAALAEATGWDPRTAELMVGTSAGSVTAATLRAGLSSADLYASTVDRRLSAEGAAVLRRVRSAGGFAASPRPDCRHCSRGSANSSTVEHGSRRSSWSPRSC